MKRLLINLIKIGVSVAILAVLFTGAQQSLYDLRNQPKNWGLLGVAAVLAMAGVCVTFVRWYWLVRALGLPFTLRDAFRLGFVGYLFNFVSLGNVGGDLFKAVFVAREQPGRRAEAVATVVIDRIVGLYALFFLASAVIVWTGMLQSTVPQIRVIAQVTVGGTILGTVAVAMLLSPGVSRGRISRALVSLPKIGPVAGRVLVAVRIYSERKGVLAAAMGASLVIHALSTACFYVIALALPGAAPSLADHFLIVPLGMVAGATPLPLSGLGATEAVVEFLYMQMPSATPVAAGAGLLVCLTFRAITIVIAIVGAAFYAANRAMMTQAVRNAERHSLPLGEEDLDDTTPADGDDALPKPQSSPLSRV